MSDSLILPTLILGRIIGNSLRGSFPRRWARLKISYIQVIPTLDIEESPEVSFRASLSTLLFDN